MDLEKLNFPREDFSEKKVCDGCSREFEAGDHVVEYFSDTIWRGADRIDLPQPFPAELYCLYCYPNSIPLPHIGTNEGFSFLTIRYTENDKEYSFDEAGIIKGSGKSSGIEWSPIELFEEFHPAPTESLNYTITPMHVFFTFRQMGIDLRGFHTDNRLQIPKEAKEKVRRLSSYYMNELHSPVFDPSML